MTEADLAPLEERGLIPKHPVKKWIWRRRCEACGVTIRACNGSVSPTGLLDALDGLIRPQDVREWCRRCEPFRTEADWGRGRQRRVSERGKLPGGWRWKSSTILDV